MAVAEPWDVFDKAVEECFQTQRQYRHSCQGCCWTLRHYHKSTQLSGLFLRRYRHTFRRLFWDSIDTTKAAACFWDSIYTAVGCCFCDSIDTTAFRTVFETVSSQLSWAVSFNCGCRKTHTCFDFPYKLAPAILRRSTKGSLASTPFRDRLLPATLWQLGRNSITRTYTTCIHGIHGHHEPRLIIISAVIWKYVKMDNH